ncbi:MAG: hypothetical protein IAA16_08250 [Candidatus Treponema excrementipullorum]|uniref:Uncharacterized protein n=1 Tax=Candidatus Treponema excrementipullorum TaxID=2838768 RepID=A0A9E2L4I5_9SPIR|nr:hypothetical protein [Candidatus Treponema excrementipullorum]
MCKIVDGFLTDDNPRNNHRVFWAFSPIRDAAPKYVLSLNKIDLSHDGIIRMNIVDFSAGKKELMLT